VCPTTDPSWTPLFVHAAGLVVERGGMLSHGAIVARDFGIPAVVLPGATRLIPEGAGVRIDGNKGRVELQKETR
jgi:pyruvate,water dikinase